jgi:hypothetical protein
MNKLAQKSLGRSRESRLSRVQRQWRSKTAKVDGSLRETEKPGLAAQPGPNLRITLPMQAKILELYLQGRSLCEIARITHRARQTVTKIVRAPEVQAKIQELKGKLLGSSDKWIESVNYAVDTELDGNLAFELMKDFGVIPPQVKYVQPAQQNGHQPMDPERLAKARAIGMIAFERGSSPPPEPDELERLARK